MKAWHFSENAYPYLPPAEDYESIRVSLPNRNYDPQKGAALYDRYIDEWLIAEDEGLEIMLNEHHQTATCVDPAAPLVLGALARLSRKARLLILGNPVANRRQPVRVAEEMAMVDILSKGRLECGFVRGVPYEVLPANSNPVRMNGRQWEAIDLVIKAWTNHDGPVSHEGRFFHHRNINIWPRPYQQPHPPIWISTTTPGGAGRVGGRGYVQATFLTGYGGTPAIYDSYRRGWREAGRGADVPVNRLAYAALVYTGESERAARSGAEKLLWYITSNKVPLHFCYPPGYVPTAVHAQILRGAAIDQHAANRANATVDKAIEAGIMFAGTPDQVFRQIKRMYDHVGGFGHLLNMGQAGFLEHEETVHGIKMFAREVYPRLREAFPDSAISGMRVERVVALYRLGLFLCTRARPRRSAPLPLVGWGWGWGSLLVRAIRATTTTPLPNPPPHGGREPIRRAAQLYANFTGWSHSSMAVVHETGTIGTPVPVYYECFAPATANARATVLMVHGGAHSGACYQRTADGRPGWAYRFAERGYRAVVPDWPGSGRSGHVPLDRLDGATVVEGLGALARWLGTPLVLLTHSMSGAYGWRLLELHGDVIAAVVGVAPAPPGNIQKLPPVYEETQTAIETEVSGRRVRIDKMGMAVQGRDFVERKLVGESRFFPREQLAVYAAELLPIAPKVLLERQNVHGSQLRVSDPKKLAGKRILVVTGTADLDHAKEVDGAIVIWLNAHGAKAEFCYLADRGIVGNGHMLMLEENSDEIADIIMGWIDTI